MPVPADRSRQHAERRPGGWHAWLLGAVTLGLFAPRAGETPHPDAAKPATSTPALPGSAPAAGAGEAQIRALIVRLDADRFDTRQEAARELASTRAAAVPYLVETLGDESCERRVRACVLLGQHGVFEEVAPWLVDAVEKPYGLRAREVLRDRTQAYLDATYRRPHMEALFKLWGTSVDAHRDETLKRLTEAKSRAETAQAVAPLLGLQAKTVRFSGAAVRLQALSLTCDHQHSPGFLIAQTLARGLAEDRPRWLTFAEQHLAALEKYAAELKAQRAPPHAVRRELADRVTMSQGAAEFLVEVLDESSPPHAIVTKRIGLAPPALTEAFCRGLASLDAGTYDRGVARVHIVDMLTEVLRNWPATPPDGVVPQLIARTREMALAGDKPKALSLLDALQACSELPQHQLDVCTGVGKQLGDRLYSAALAAPDIRRYSPARRLHDKFVGLADLGIAPDHEAFPRPLWERYLQGADAATSDEQLLAVDRYLRILGRLRAAGAGLEQPGVRPLVRVLRDGVTAQPAVLAAAVSRIDQILAAVQAPGGLRDARAIAAALGPEAGLPPAE